MAGSTDTKQVTLVDVIGAVAKSFVLFTLLILLLAFALSAFGNGILEELGRDTHSYGFWILVTYFTFFVGLVIDLPRGINAGKR